jgi:hypothetical protein
MTLWPTLATTRGHRRPISDTKIVADPVQKFLAGLVLGRAHFLAKRLGHIGLVTY